MPSYIKPSDPPEFVREVENFAASTPVAEILCRLEDQVLADWRLAQSTEAREQAWHARNAIDELRTKIASVAGGKTILDTHAKTRPRPDKTAQTTRPARQGSNNNPFTA